jgi:hypothetical protein
MQQLFCEHIGLILLRYFRHAAEYWVKVGRHFTFYIFLQDGGCLARWLPGSAPIPLRYFSRTRLAFEGAFSAKLGRMIGCTMRMRYWRRKLAVFSFELLYRYIAESGRKVEVHSFPVLPRNLWAF